MPFECNLLIRCLYKMLLIMGLGLFKRNLAKEFFKIIYSGVFRRYVWLEGKFAIDSETYLKSIFLLNCKLLLIEPIKPINSWPNLCYEMHEILIGNYGPGNYYALGIVLIPDREIGPPTEMQLNLCQENLQEWYFHFVNLQLWIEDNLPMAMFPLLGKMWKGCSASELLTALVEYNSTNSVIPS